MEERVNLGVTSEFAWYELTNMRDKLQSAVSNIDHLIAVIKQREKEQHEYIIHLRKQCDSLQVQVNTLREAKHG